MEEGGFCPTKEDVTMNQTLKATEEIVRLLQRVFSESPSINPLNAVTYELKL
jgi:hypothetical protein